MIMFFNTTPWWNLVMLYFENKLFLKSSCDCSPGSTIWGSWRTFWIWSPDDWLGPVECNFGVMTSLYDLELPAFSTPGIWTKGYNKVVPIMYLPLPWSWDKTRDQKWVYAQEREYDCVESKRSVTSMMRHEVVWNCCVVM